MKQVETKKYKIILSPAYKNYEELGKKEFENLDDAKSYLNFNMPRFIPYKISEVKSTEETILEYNPPKPHYNM